MSIIDQTIRELKIEGYEGLSNVLVIGSTRSGRASKQVGKLLQEAALPLCRDVRLYTDDGAIAHHDGQQWVFEWPWHPKYHTHGIYTISGAGSLAECNQ